MTNQASAQPETIDVWRKRLTFRAWHRGTREMDLLIGTFADRHISGFGPEELAQFEEILTHNDPDVYDWITGQKVIPANLMSSVMERLCRHRFA